MNKVEGPFVLRFSNPTKERVEASYKMPENMARRKTPDITPN